jgi:hypothetical protein
MMAEYEQGPDYEGRNHDDWDSPMDTLLDFSYMALVARGTRYGLIHSEEISQLVTTVARKY